LNNINILIPMAGLGSRFAEKGYEKPKPLIDVNGVPMIKAVVDSLNISGHYIFIVQKSHSTQYHLLDVLDEIAPGCTVIEIDELTEGAAVTTLAAKDLINNDTPLLIANSDQIIVWDSSIVSSILPYKDFIALFLATDPKWSFSKTTNGWITRVAEKNPISNFANVGIYGWTKGSDYVKYAEQMISKNIRTNDEFYVAPVYNEAIADGKKILGYLVDKMYGVGTPEDLEFYIGVTNNAV
jgi:NDP-sugar pyrophosphorylase family protein